MTWMVSIAALVVALVLAYFQITAYRAAYNKKREQEKADKDWADQLANAVASVKKK